MSDPPPNYVSYATPILSSKDSEHLRLLSLFHYIYGGLVAVLCSFGLIHVVMGLMMVRNPGMFPTPTGPGGPPFNMGWMFVIFGGFFVLMGWTLGALSIISGRFISQRRARTYSLIIAGINCLWVPFGTILGVFTFIVLVRPSVIALYQGNASETASY
jgi:hypothetical protein